MKSRLFTLLNLLVCLALLAPGGVQPVTAAQSDPLDRALMTQPLVPGLVEPPVLLRLRVGGFDPLAGEPDIPAGMRRTLTFEQAGLRLIQFAGPIQDAWYPAITRAGLQVVTFLPDYGYLVWGSGANVAGLELAAPVRWSGLYYPFYALHPDLSDLQLPSEVEVTVQVYDHSEADGTLQAILDQAQVLDPPQTVLTYRNLSVRIASDKLAWLVSLPDVVNVEPRPRFEKMDEVQGQIMAGALNAAGTQPSGPGYLSWLSSTLGFTTNAAAYPIVDVTDDGIDDGTATPRHADFWTWGLTTTVDRLAYNYNWTTDAAADGLAGHGNLNASIVAAYNDKTGFPYEDTSGGVAGFNYGLGISPFGRVAGSKIFCNSGSFCLPGSNYTALVSNTYALGARISSNSWGANTGGAYVTSDQTYDALVRDAQPGSGAYAGNQQTIIVFSAGNAGSGSNTTGSPGNAKNVITVGAAENYRPTWTDGCSIGPTGADNAQDMISFSSRGPTDDSRVKPDIVAPGTHIEGAASQDPGYNGTGVCDQYMPAGQTLYAASSGTSHSAPAIAGATSLVYRYYQDRFGGNPPSPAMVKAYMINATRYLTGTGTSALPSNAQGYGEIHLGKAFDGTPRMVVDQSTVFGNSGQVYQAQGNVADTGKPFRVTLAWTDAPGPTVGNAYVNNLDLAVTIGGNTYKGNVFSGGASATGGSADPRNNVESVFLPAGQSGAFTIVITATNIAGDGVPGNADLTDQDFALVVYNTGVGFLSGVISDASSGSPIVGASVQAAGSSFTNYGTSGAGGAYWMSLPGGIYTVTASAYGYAPNMATGVSVITGMTTTLNLALSPAALRVVSGAVRDATTGWPLYASLDIAGYAGGTVWTNPATGLYSVSLPEGSTSTFNVNAWAPGYTAASVLVGPLMGNTTQDFALTANATTCNAPGYQAIGFSENFDSATPPNLPTGWAKVDVSGTAGDWATNAGTRYPSGYPAHSTPNLAYFNSFSASSGSQTRLYRTIGTNMTVVSSYSLSLWMYHDIGYTGNNDRVQVQVSTDSGLTWQGVGAAIPRYNGSTGWAPHTLDLSGYASQTDLRVGFLGISVYGNDVHIDDIALGNATCVAQAGGLVVGNVYNANTNMPLTGAQVSNDSGRFFTAAATPDPAVADSFYTLFSPSGSHTFTATMSGNYGTAVTTTNVVQSNTKQVDLYVPAASLSYNPPTLQATLLLSTTSVVPFTLTNSGGMPATFELREESGGFSRTLVTVPPSNGRINATIVGVNASKTNSETLHWPGWTYFDPNPLAAGQINVLLVYADYATTADSLRTILDSYADVGAVDTWQASSYLGGSTPTLNDLLPYDVVIAWNNYAYVDAVAMGNVLADYVDAGGKVILTTFNWGDSPLDGRIMSALYSPFTFIQSGSHTGDTSLGSYDTSHPIMQGVTAVTAYYRAYVGLDSGATLVASWSDGEEFVATKSNVVGINAWPDPSNWIGDLGIIFHNAVNYLAGVQSDIPWLSESPITGTIAAGNSQTVDVVFNAGDPITQTGRYTGTLHVLSNDPITQNYAVPVMMTVVTECLSVSGADFSYIPASPVAGKTVTFTGSVVSGTSPINYAWTFGDGGTGNGQVATHVFATAGPFTVIMTASNTCPSQQTVTKIVTVLPPPDITVSPLALTAGLNQDGSTSRSLTIGNVGGSNLTWSLVESPSVSWLSESSAGGTVAPSNSTIVTVNFNAAGLPPDVPPYTTTLQIYSDDPDENPVSVPVTLTVASCVAVSGADFSYTPVNALIGRAVTFTGSLAAGQSPITYTWGFDDGGSGTGQVVAHTFAVSRTYNVAMTVANACPSQQVVSKLVTAYNSPDITVSPSALTATLNPSLISTRTLMIGNVGTTGLNWSLAENPGATWLSEAPGSGTVATSGSASVIVTFTTTGLGRGVYTTWLQITSDDAYKQLVSIPVTLTVIAPDIVVSPPALVDTLNTGITYTRLMTVSNVGEVNLTWSLVESPTVSWLSESPTGGTVIPGNSANVAITCNTVGLGAGVYTTTLRFTSNDPAEPVVPVPVTLTVIVPDIVVSPAALTATLYLGALSTDMLTIGNVGLADLIWTLVETPAVTWLGETSNSGTVAPGNNTSVGITFSAAGLARGVYTTTLQVASNDPDTPVTRVPVMLTVLAPDIAVSPPALMATLAPGYATVNRTLTISNVGTADLTWSLAETPETFWLTESQAGGTVVSGTNTNVVVSFEATGLTAKVYTTTLRITSNDPDTSVTSVPVTLTVAVNFPATPGEDAWTRVADSGVNNPNNTTVIAIKPFGTYLYASTWNTATGAVIMRSPDGKTWSPVTPDGLGNPKNWGIYGLAEYNGYLYVGTRNDDVTQSPQVWRSSSGNPGSWAEAPNTGLGNAQLAYWSLLTYGNRLWAGCATAGTQAELWSYDSSTTNWTQEAIPGFGAGNDGIYSLGEFQGDLYIGASNAAGAEVWRRSKATGAWAKAAQNGFGNAQNRIAYTMRVYNDVLYVGTLNTATGAELYATRDGASWERIFANGFDDPSNIAIWNMLESDGYFILATESASGGRLYRTMDGRAWMPVSLSGFGNPTGLNTRVWGMAVFGGPDGLHLYAGTDNSTGAEIWRAVLPQPDEFWTQVERAGFDGDALNSGILDYAEYNGALYAAVANSKGAQVWRTLEGRSWTQAGTDGLGDSNNMGAYALTVHNNQLYVGTENVNGARVYRWNETSAAWEGINLAGFGDVNNRAVYALASFNGNLYAGTWNYSDRAEVWRYSGSGTGWTNVSPPDATFEAGNQWIRSMIVYGGYLYVGTFNSTGAELWRTNGATWQPVNTDGQGSVGNDQLLALYAFSGYLYAGYSNAVTGGQVWRSQNGQTGWTQINRGGFGRTVNDPTNIRILSMADWDGYLYVGAENHQPITGYAQNLESGNGGFTAGGSYSSWAWGAPANGPGNAHSGAKVWATNLFGNYNNNEVSFLMSPEIDLGAYARKTLTLSWWQWLQTEQGYDFAAVEVSKDGGSTWKMVYAASGNVDLAWTQHSVTLDPTYAVSNLRVLFYLQTDGSNTDPGWYIDDVVIGIAGTGGEVWRTAVGASQADWEQVNADGFSYQQNMGIWAIQVFSDSLYAGTGNPSAGAEVWRASRSDVGPATPCCELVNVGIEVQGASWIRVNGAATVPIRAPNAGIYDVPLKRPGAYSITVEYVEGNRTLTQPILAIVRPDGAAQLSHGAPIQMMGPLAAQEAWSSVATGGVNDAHNTAVPAMQPFKGYLYAGTCNATDGFSILRSPDGQTWRPVLTGGSGMCVYALVEYNGYLYVGVRNDAGQARLYRSATGDTGTWQEVPNSGLGILQTAYWSLLVYRDPILGRDLLWAGDSVAGNLATAELWTYDSVNGTWNREIIPGFDVDMDHNGYGDNAGIYVMHEFQGDLYIGTKNYATGAEVWRRSGTTGAWTRVAQNGLGRSNNTIIYALEVYNGVLYVGTYNQVTGAELYATRDGNSWETIFTRGFDDPANVAIWRLIESNGYLYLGTQNAAGGRVYRTVDGSFWTPASLPGFGNASNTQVWGMATFQAASSTYLYAGTANNNGAEIWRTIVPQPQEAWQQVERAGIDDDGYNDAILSTVEYNGSIYVGTHNGVAGGQVWKSSDGRTWLQVGLDGLTGDASNRYIDSLATHNGQLYAGVDSLGHGARVYRWDEMAAAWEQVNGEGFGTINNKSALAMTSFNGSLYASTYNSTDRARVFRYTGSGANWINVSPPDATFESSNWWIDAMTVYSSSAKNYLYIGTANNTSGGEIWRYDGATWESVTTDAFGNSNSRQVQALLGYKGYLYASFRNAVNGGQVWRSQTGAGGAWAQVNQSGFGRQVDDPSNAGIPAMSEWNGYLYAGTENSTTAGEVWRTAVGAAQSDWEQVNTDGFGWKSNTAIMTLLGLGDHIYAGTNNSSLGAEIWRTGLPGVSPGRFAQVVNVSVRASQAATLTVTGAANWNYRALTRGVYPIPLPVAGVYNVSASCGQSFPIYLDTLVPVVDHFTLGPIANQTTNMPFAITLQAWATSGETTTVPITGVIVLTDSTGTISPTSVIVTNTSSAALMVTIGVSRTNVVITPSFSIKVGRPSNAFAVSDLARFRFKPISSPQQVGRPFSVVITAENALNGVASGYSSTATLSSNVPGGALAPTVVTFTSGVASFNVTLGFTGTNVVLRATHPTLPSIVGDSNPFDAISALTDVAITGPAAGTVNTAYTFTAAVSPPTATLPITYTWSPAPDSGQGTSVATFQWPTGGVKTITVTAANAGSSASGACTINVSVPLSGVSINGTAGGTVNMTYAFTATVSPPTATTPITYTWSPEPNSGQGAAVAAYAWPTASLKMITVTATNVGGAFSDTHIINIVLAVEPVQSVTISGPVTGTVNVVYVFTATISPVTATLPIAYTWSPAPGGGQGTAVVTYTWPTIGAKTITVTATNGGDTVSDPHTIQIGSAGYRIYLPVVLRQ